MPTEETDEMLDSMLTSHKTRFCWSAKTIWSDLPFRTFSRFMMPRCKAKEKPEQINEQLETHGRGLPIISAIASKISRQRYCGLNESIFVIPLRKNKTETTKI